MNSRLKLKTFTGPWITILPELKRPLQPSGLKRGSGFGIAFSFFHFPDFIHLRFLKNLSFRFKCYPLSLIIPVKYGIKHLKRIGTLYFSGTPPPDYRAEQGY